MTLSNFDWTDKDSVKWFLMLPTGHTGPYSLNQLLKLLDEQTISIDIKIWAEGLSEPVGLKDALSRDEVPDLPPIPEDDIPPIPLPIEEDVPTENVPEFELPPTEEEVVPEAEPSKPRKLIFFAVAAIALVIIVGVFVQLSGKFSISRFPKMTIDLHERILRENSFEGWDKKIFFKEYLPADHSNIWLVTSSFHRCDVEANFSSIKDKLLSEKDETVSFKTQGQLKDHVVEFSQFDFTTGTKIIPGLYELDVRAFNCEWDGIAPKLMNIFSPPDAEYMARTKVVLFSRGQGEFQRILDKLVKKKVEVAKKEKNRNEVFWQDLQQKFETLQAITLQIEQHFLDFLDIPPGPPGTFTKNLKAMVNDYTRKYGSFLTSFVVENENYFKGLDSEAKGASRKRNYELMVKLSTKRIGLESMKFIEEYQAIKKAPNKAELEKHSEKVKKAFSSIKADLNQKLLQISEDRAQ